MGVVDDQMIAYCQQCESRRLLTQAGRCDACGSDAIDCKLYPVCWTGALEHTLRDGLAQMREQQREQEVIDSQVEEILRRSQ